MGDLPERLRETAEASVRTPHEYQISVLDEAADEIERLRAKIDALHIDIQGRSSTCALLQRQNEMLQRKVEELERELASHRQFLERLTDNGTNYQETFDDLVELGLVVSVPPTPEFIDEWGEDSEMYVLAWKAGEFEKESRR